MLSPAALAVLVRILDLQVRARREHQPRDQIRVRHRERVLLEGEWELSFRLLEITGLEPGEAEAAQRRRPVLVEVVGLLEVADAAPHCRGVREAHTQVHECGAAQLQRVRVLR